MCLLAIRFSMVTRFHTAADGKPRSPAICEDWLGLKADLGGNYKSTGGVGAREYNILFGPQLMHQADKLHFFVHGLVGVAHFSADVGPSSTGAGWVIGGGVDYDLGSSNFAFRPVQLDYHGAHVFSNTQSDARYSVGLVYRFK